MFMIESIDEIRNFYQLTSGAQSSYPLQQSRIFGLPSKQMELFILFIVALLIAILVLPFVALAKANRAKRGLDDLAARLSSLENEVRNLQPHAVPAPKSEAAAAAPKAFEVPPRLPITTAAPTVPEKESAPPANSRKVRQTNAAGNRSSGQTAD